MANGNSRLQTKRRTLSLNNHTALERLTVVGQAVGWLAGWHLLRALAAAKRRVSLGRH